MAAVGLESRDTDLKQALDLQLFETTEYLSFHGKDPSPVPNRDFYISYGEIEIGLRADNAN